MVKKTKEETEEIEKSGKIEETEELSFEKKLKIQNQFLRSLHDISNSIQCTEDVNEILELTIKAFKLWGYDRVRIYLFDKQKKLLMGAKSSHMPDISMKNIKLDISQVHKKVYHCFTKKEPIILKTSQFSKFVKILKKEDVNESASLPLLSGTRVIGMISIDNKYSENPLIKEDLYNLFPFANQVAFAIDNTVLHREDRIRLKKLTAMYDISSSLTKTLDLDEILSLIIVKIIQLLNSDSCTITLLDKSNQFLIPKSTYSSSEEYFNHGPIPVDDSVAGLAVKTRQPVYIQEVLKEPLYARPSFAKSVKLMSLLTIPLIVKDKSLGTINIYTKKLRRYNKDELDLLKTLANQAAMSIRNSEFYTSIKKERHVLSNLLEISQTINAQLDLDNLLNIIMDRTMEFTNSDSGFLLLVKGDYLDMKLIKGYPIEKAENVRIKIDEGLSGWVAKQGKPLIVPDVRKDKRYIEVNRATVSEAVIPLMKAGKVIGVLNLDSVKFNNFEKFKQPLEILTNHIAIAIENSKLYNEISLFNETLKNEVFMATKELVEKNRELERMDRLKSEFVSNVSHELRTPLTSIKGYTKLLLGGKLGMLPENQMQCLNIIIEESDRLSRLINDVLDLAKLEKGKVKFKKEKMDIIIVAGDVIKTLATLADDKDIKIHLDVKKDIPKISASQDLIKQIFFNLIGNAIKFTPKDGNIYVIIELMDNFIKTTVKDTGIGVPKEVIPRLFDKFYQVDASMTRQYGGTGLGLPISKHIVDAHKGKIYVESEINKGSSFIFELPIKKKIEFD
ncbi:GAF domain-containing protein [Candidatus Woesearchaeota archaeon]|jgi:signal transduction histidine kinase|nr:GAF domain-containing protein [Candidatus Woesearchaeota archaeon]